ncbi:MAG TPA: hypothetical protein VL119_09670 [Acidimicrobiia bacterium]|nr:hypothetical protein [Acidimicrobiia bacterium]
MKRCKVCGESKPLDQFYRSAGMADGYRSDCILCNLAAERARTARDPQANRDRVRRWQRANADRHQEKQRSYVRSGQKQLEIERVISNVGTG